VIARRKLTMAVAVCAVGTWRVTRAQQPSKALRVALLATGSPQTTGYVIDAFKDRLRELGHVEGRNVMFDVRWALGDVDRLPALAQELVALGPDVVWAPTTAAALAAQKATTTIPIVVAAAADPVALGFARSLPRPGGNVTGVASLVADVSPKMLELLRAVRPQLVRVAVLWTNPNPQSTLANLAAAAQSVNVGLVVVEVATAADLDGAFARSSRERVEAIIVPGGTLAYLIRRQIIDRVDQHRLPSIFPQREYAVDGGLMSYGQNLAAALRQSASHVDKILRGAKPGDLPFEQATTLEFVINVKTAKRLGLTIPKSVLLRADEVIE
jgi:putative ABC transport system substrate-binding protein